MYICVLKLTICPERVFRILLQYPLCKLLLACACRFNPLGRVLVVRCRMISREGHILISEYGWGTRPPPVSQLRP